MAKTNTRLIIAGIRTLENYSIVEKSIDDFFKK